MARNKILREVYEILESNQELAERAWIVVAVGWFTWVFADGFLWIVIFGAGFFLGKRSESDPNPVPKHKPNPEANL